MLPTSGGNFLGKSKVRPARAASFRRRAVIVASLRRQSVRPRGGGLQSQPVMSLVADVSCFLSSQELLLL